MTDGDERAGWGWCRRALSVADAPDSRTPVATLTVGALALVMVGGHLYQLLTFDFPSGQFRNFHLGFAIAIGFLVLSEALAPEARLRRAALWLAAGLVAAVAVYIHVEYQALTQVRSFLPNTADIVAASTLLLLALLLSGLQWGWMIPVLALAGLAYGYWGNHLPGEIFFHSGLAFQRLLAYTSIPYFQGLLGGLTSLSANTFFVFLLFGGAVKATGAIDFIVNVGFAVGKNSRAGPAWVAVISSALMGTVSGSTVANVASTGALTIPMMKRYGFRGSFAAATEAVSSTGGQLMPPVMGLAAFLIVGITGIPYGEVIVAAIAPAIIYYAYLLMAVHLRATSLDLDARRVQSTEDAPPLGREAAGKWHLVVAIVLLVWLLVTGTPAGLSALVAVLILLGLDALIVLWQGRGRFAAWGRALARIANGLISGARAGAAVATVIAVIGILIEVLTVTGFAQKLSFFMLDLSNGRLLNLAVVVAISCLVFGLGLPTSAAYFIVALFGAPALVEIGVPLLAAHMFVFYFANLSAITPPVAVAALVGAKVADANFWQTSFIAVRLGLPGFLLPFIFLLEPQILGLTGHVGDQLLAMVKLLLAIFALNFAIEGRMFVPLALWGRAVTGAAALGLLYWDVWVELAALALLAGVAAFNLARYRRLEPSGIST